MLGLFRSKVPSPPTLETIKQITSVLIIDDEEPKELREHLKKEGWKNTYIEDLDVLSNRKLQDSQIICVDIMGVGRKLQLENGLELVKEIKIKYPEKKVIVYSSVSQQDIFTDALDYADKRLRKQSSLIPFSSAIEEMANKTFSWEDCLKHAYQKIAELEKLGISFEKFKSITEKSINGTTINTQKLAKSGEISLDVASKIASLISLALSV